jgi:hypothetical protein
MVINLASLPQETIEKYDLNELAQDGKVYIEIQKGIYGLPQAGVLANELLQRNLAKDGYRPTIHTHGLWTHDTRPILFSLVVDDFGVKYVGRDHQKRQKTHKRSNFNRQQSSQTRNVFSSRSRNWSSFHKRKGRSCPQDNIGGIGTQTAPHTNGNG